MDLAAGRQWERGRGGRGAHPLGALRDMRVGEVVVLLFSRLVAMSMDPPGAERLREEETSNVPRMCALVVAMSTVDAVSF